uniref:Glycosyltransferase family 92 protein n=1 Tax=Rhabditophanes sp. KR3021 TaxID=114890 RepID=A0AC35U674_9BILA
MKFRYCLMYFSVAQLISGFYDPDRDHLRDITVTTQTSDDRYSDLALNVAPNWFENYYNSIFVVGDRPDLDKTKIPGRHYVAASCNVTTLAARQNCMTQLELEIMVHEQRLWSCHINNKVILNSKKLVSQLGFLNLYSSEVFIGKPWRPRSPEKCIPRAPEEIAQETFWCLSIHSLDEQMVEAINNKYFLKMYSEERQNNTQNLLDFFERYGNIEPSIEHDMFAYLENMPFSHPDDYALWGYHNFVRPFHPFHFNSACSNYTDKFQYDALHCFMKHSIARKSVFVFSMNAPRDYEDC